MFRPDRELWEVSLLADPGPTRSASRWMFAVRRDLSSVPSALATPPLPACRGGEDGDSAWQPSKQPRRPPSRRDRGLDRDLARDPAADV